MSKRLSVITLIALMLTASFAFAEEPEAVKGPRLTLVEPLKDFGTVAKGEKLEWSFQVKNTGTADLEIIAAKPTCALPVAPVSQPTFWSAPRAFPANTPSETA